MKFPKAFEQITEIIGWIQIALSPTLFGVLIGFVVYSFIPNYYGIAAAIVIAFFGIISGIVLANNKYRKEGTMSFLSRIDSTPDIDKWIQSDQVEDKSNAEEKDKNGV